MSASPNISGVNTAVPIVGNGQESRAPRAEIVRACHLFMAPGDVHEVRILKTERDGTISGYFQNLDNFVALTDAVLQYDGNVPGVYFTLNPCSAELLARAANRLKRRASATTADKDILRRRWLPLDFDPKRPADISSTDAEQGRAIAVALSAGKKLSSVGFPDPIVAASGNGAYLLYRLADLPNDQESTELIKRVLAGVKARCESDDVAVDLTMFNAARICKLFGTKVKKGDPIPSRPHRRSRLLEVPAEVPAVTTAMLEAAAAWATEKPSTAHPVHPRIGESIGTPFDLEVFISRNLAVRRGPIPWDVSGSKWELEECPFNPAEHTGGCAVVTRGSNGAIGFRCQHHSCVDRHWKDVRELFGGPRPTAPSNAPNEWVPQPVAMPAGPQATILQAPLTDLGNAERFAALHAADVRYCHPWKTWLVWDGSRYRVDDTGEITRRAKAVTRRMFEMAVRYSDTEKRDQLLKHARESEKHARIMAMISLAACEPAVPVLPADLDSDLWLLNVENGTIDLRTGELLEHRRENLITKLCPVRYDPNATCGQWLKFLDQIMGGSQDLITFKQRAIGYSLTGVATEKRALFIYHGSGNNGKTTELELTRDMLGDYAGQVRIESLMEQRYRDGAAASPDIADLRGLRFVISSEPTEGHKLAEATVKYLTGMGTIKARHLRRENFEFKQTWKFFLDCNHKPVIRGTDAAIWNRIGLVPFDVVIPDEQIDRELPLKLRNELPGILAWCVRGCLDWQRHGLGVPERVREATNEYRREMDSISRYIEECCIVGEYSSARGKELYASYRKWAEESGESGMTLTTFGTLITEKGFTKTHDDKGVKYSGIGIAAKA